MGYRGVRFIRSVKDHFNKDVEIIARSKKHYWVPKHVSDVSEYLRRLGHTVSSSFQVQPKRWIVERTFAWIGKYRRLSKDYEFNMTYSEGLIYLAMIKNMAKKIIKSQV